MNIANRLLAVEQSLSNVRTDLSKLADAQLDTPHGQENRNALNQLDRYHETLQDAIRIIRTDSEHSQSLALCGEMTFSMEAGQ